MFDVVQVRSGARVVTDPSRDERLTAFGKATLSDRYLMPGESYQDMTATDVKRYIRFIADRRLIQLGLQPIYAKDAKNPLPWMDQMLNAIEHTNFFENRATEYSKASTKGTWEEAFS